MSLDFSVLRAFLTILSPTLNILETCFRVCCFGAVVGISIFCAPVVLESEIFVCYPNNHVVKCLDFLFIFLFFFIYNVIFFFHVFSFRSNTLVTFARIDLLT